MSTHGRIEAATITATDLAATEHAWTRHLEYTVADRGAIDTTLATTWGAPSQAGQDYVLLRPASGADVFIRLVEGSAPADCAPRRTLGWAALELTVTDADALCARLRHSELEILGKPRLLENLAAFYPMQIAGAAGEVIYLNEVRDDLPTVDLPRARSPVDHLFIVILGAADLSAARDFYRDRLRFEIDTVYEVPYTMINQAFGFEPDRRHRLLTTRVGRRVNVEIDQYPSEATPRPSLEGMLPPAIAMISFSVDNLAALEFTPAGTRLEPPYAGRPYAVCRGAAGELIELIEAA
ncbi:MAG: hypothetical protein AAF481_20145 [Acidobacteriota bacterium]